MNTIHPIETGRQQAIHRLHGASTGLDADPLVQSTKEYGGRERRASRRIPRSLEITVQPLDDQMIEYGEPFFAITRDISQGGLAYLSSRQADFEKAVVAINDGIAPGIVCRICNSSVIHTSGMEKFCLTNVEFLFVHQHPK